MSGTLRESEVVATTAIDEVLATTEAIPTRAHNGESTNGNGAHPSANGESVVEHAEADAATSQAAYVASLELRLGELAEIEKMRDLEIHHLEAELEQHADRAWELETALFHAERRGKDLERRWQDLAEVYETAAAALVVAGGQLEAIQHQAGYRLALRVSGFIRRYPAVYQRLHRRLHRSLNSPT